MKNRLAILIPLLCLFSLSTPVVLAQETPVPLEYGETRIDKITADRPEVRYLFNATEDDVIVVEMTATSFTEGVENVVLKLIDPAGVTLVDSTGRYENGMYGQTSAYIAARLNNSGKFIIVATRADESVGEFEITLTLAKTLTSAETILQTQDSESPPSYFYAEPSEASELVYIKKAGEMSPEIIISTLAEPTYTLEEDMTMYGEKLTFGVLGVLEAETPYLIKVDRAIFSFYFGGAEVEYTLTLQTGR